MKAFPVVYLSYTGVLVFLLVGLVRDMRCHPGMSCYVQRDPSELSLETAMRVYNLKESEVLWEKSLDTKLVMAWNEHMMVLAFRGTASVSNALADLQVSPGSNSMPAPHMSPLLPLCAERACHHLCSSNVC